MGLKIGNVVQVKTGTVARTNTSAKRLFTLPPNAIILGVRAFGVNSDSATSATLTFENTPADGSSSAATFATVNAKATAAGAVAATLSGISYNRQDKHQYIGCKYSEVGAASTGGAWSVVVEYI